MLLFALIVVCGLAAFKRVPWTAEQREAYDTAYAEQRAKRLALFSETDVHEP